jgi:phosphoribosylformylglycinamidine synthase
LKNQPFSLRGNTDKGEQVAMYHRIEVAYRLNFPDPKGCGITNQIRNFLELPVDSVRTREVYSLFLDCDAPQADQILQAFTNPVIQEGHLGQTTPNLAFDWVIIVGFRPGVTDNVSRSARSAVGDILGRALREDEKIYTSTECFLGAPNLNRDQAEHIACDLLANELIQTTTVLSRAEWDEKGAPVNQPEFDSIEAPGVKIIDLEVSDEELMRISREGILALTLEEMKVIQAYYRDQAASREAKGLSASPTDVELEMLAQTWSEHCKHKIFSAKIDYTDETGKNEQINSCFKTFIYNSTKAIEEKVDWLVSVFHDNAGVIKFNDKVNLVYKVETHNSPTALDPYGGAMTGIVGVNRDPMGTGMGADLLLNVWGYCFGSPFTPAEDVPKGLFHPRRLRDQVHKGVIDGGNQSGIPYAQGWEYFDPRYLGKPLVYCGTAGTIPVTVGGEPSEDKSIEPGDVVVMTGGRIGKDGIHGATFSSEELHKDSPTQAVQIGDPITQKIMNDFLREARDANLYRFVTDNGAGGLSSSLGEMAELCGGCEIDLAKAPLKYAGLQPWEILVSEAQERMSLAVPPERLERFLELARERNVEASVLGNFTNDGKFLMTYNEKTVACLDIDFLHNGLPQLSLKATWETRQHETPAVDDSLDLGATITGLLGRLNVCSNEFKSRQYDHEVKGLSVIKPFVGVNNNISSDATVSMAEPLGTEGVILASGLTPRYSDIDTYHMMASAIDIAVRRTVAVGGCLGHIAGLDNFCWPDPVASPANPDGEYKCAQLVRANQALYDYTIAFGVPLISGKDSMKNDSTVGGRRISIPPTVLFSTIAKMDDISKAVTLDAKRYGDLVYVIGQTSRELGGSEFYASLDAVGNDVPKVDAEYAKQVYAKVSQATAAELCHSLHTPVYGGLGIGFAKVAMGGHLGLTIDLDRIPSEGDLSPAEVLFSESNTRFIATIAPQKRDEFEALMNGIPCACVGQVELDPTLVLRQGGNTVCQTRVDDLVNAYTTTLDNI